MVPQGTQHYIVDCCGIVVGRCGIIVGRCGSLWVVPGFSTYAPFFVSGHCLVISYCHPGVSLHANFAP